ncbi:MAG TPA: dTMP kinase [Candidatus Binataceae bacterium]|nr:dTMP kinase [Candidatus Binataceae bacterium]
MARGLFITLEGVEGSGKTTQAAILGETLGKEGRTAIVTHEPGGTRAGQAIRKIFLDPEVTLDVASELLLVLADRAQHVREMIAPRVEAGDIVISDRYSDSTVAYQGYGRGFDLPLLKQLNHLATAGMIPDLTIVLDCPAEVGLARTRERVKGKEHRFDRFESEMVEFHRRVRDGFLAIAKAEPNRVKIINAEDSPESIAAAILSAAHEFIRVRCP